QNKPTDALLPPLEREQKNIIEDMIAKARNYDKLLPDFVCTQMSHHNLDPQGKNQWKTLDTISEELNFTRGTAEYTVLGENGKKPANPAKRPANLVSIDEFSQLIHDIYDPPVGAKFGWTKWDSVRGHRTHMFTFLVPQEKSEFQVMKPKPFTSGLLGYVWIDADTNLIVRIQAAAANIPKSNSVQGVTYDLGYEFTRVGDKVYLLPLQGDLRERDGKSQHWNEVEFKDYKAPPVSR
ncbi:MAG TPA: hypothetical protein VKS01_02265, partial [Bryobacteraceae bacterium]|nr:hypothetical protein [Bryobacteraceae bacterium]